MTDEEKKQLAEALERLAAIELRLRDAVIVTSGFISSAAVANNGYYRAFINGQVVKVTVLTT